MRGPRKPKNLDDYCSVELAAKGLEDYAKDMRSNSSDGDLVRWSLNARFWNSEWEQKPKAPAPVAPEEDGK